MRLLPAILVAMLTIVAPAAAADEVGALLDPYFRIQTALSDDKTDGVKADAAAIETAAAGLGAAGTPIAAAAKQLAAAPDLGAARVAFGALSDAIVSYAESTKIATGDDVHVMFCPMVNKQWMQKGERVSNPYYGKSMLTCGEKKKKSS